MILNITYLQMFKEDLSVDAIDEGLLLQPR